MKITLNIEIDNPAELLPIATALTTVQEVLSPELPETHPKPLEELPAPKVCPSIPKPKKTPVIASQKVDNSSYNREALEIEARELGITFRSDIKDSTLAQRIEDFKKKNPIPSKPDNDPISFGEDEAKDELKELIRAKAKEEAKELPEKEEEQEEEKEPESTTSKEEDSDDTPFEDSAEDSTDAKEEEKEEDSNDDELKKAFSSRKAIKSNKLRKVKKVSWE